MQICMPVLKGHILHKVIEASVQVEMYNNRGLITHPLQCPKYNEPGNQQSEQQCTSINFQNSTATHIGEMIE